MNFMTAYLAACGCSETASLLNRLNFMINVTIIGAIVFFAGLTYVGTHLQAATAQAMNYYMPQHESEIVKVQPSKSRATKHNHLSKHSHTHGKIAAHN